MVTVRSIKGLQLPHQLGKYRTGNPQIDQAFDAIDDDFRHLLNLIEEQQQLQVPWVSITDFGAVPDTGRDNTQAFAQAQAAAASVLVPPGTWDAEQIRLLTGRRIFGSHGSIIRSRTNSHTIAASGTASSGSANSLVDSGAGWVVGAFKGFTVRTTAGTGSGQRRLIVSNTADTVVPDPLTPFSPAPDATTVFQILEPKHLFVLDTPGVEFATVDGITLDGNKANQLAWIDAFRFLNTGGGPTFTDEHHLLQNLIIHDFSGSGVVKSRDCREMRVINVVVRECDEYGFDNFIEQVSVSGGSDTWYSFCTAAHNGKSGYRCNAGIDQYAVCKAFGNGARALTGDRLGFLLTLGPNLLIGCTAQENPGGGFMIKDSYNHRLEGCIADANDGVGVTLDNCFECSVQVNVSSSGGLAYQTDNALTILNGADRNHVDLLVVESELSGGVLAAGSQRNGDNDVRINRRNYNRYFSYGRVKGTDADEHFTAGKIGSPAANNHIFVWKSTAENPPRYILETNDGTTSLELFAVDPGNGAIQFVGTARVKGLLIGSDNIDVGSIAADTTAELAITVSGAASGDRCSASPTGEIEAGLDIECVWAETDEVHVRMRNVTGVAIDPASRVWVASVWKH